MLAAAACGAQSAKQSAQDGSESKQAEPPLTGSAEDFERAQFDDPTDIDNEWLPLKPGTQWVIKGSSIRGGGEREVREEHRIVETVTDLTKVVDGVRTVVMYDEDWHEGQLLEPEVRFHAQDNEGNVWHFGQYREEYEDGKLVEPLGWVPGQKGARAGISMPADPRLGTPSYAQGYAPPPVTWDDRARVYKMGQQTCVPVDCYENVLVTEEFEPSIKGAFQLKYYAQGVGNVRIGWRGEKEEERDGGAGGSPPAEPGGNGQDPREGDRTGSARLRAATKGRTLLAVHQGGVQSHATGRAHATGGVTLRQSLAR